MLATHPSMCGQCVDDTIRDSILKTMDFLCGLDESPVVYASRSYELSMCSVSFARPKQLSYSPRD